MQREVLFADGHELTARRGLMWRRSPLLTRLVGIVVLLTCACGNRSGAAQLTFSGATPPVGGGYRVALVRADGTPIEGVAPKFVTTSAGEQTLTLRLDSPALYRDNKALVRVAVDALANENDPVPLGHGSTLLEVRKREVAQATVTLAPPPNLPEAAASMRYTSLPDGHGVVVDAPSLEGFALVAWGERADGRLSKLTVMSNSPETIELADERLVDRKDFNLLITGEVVADPSVLRQPVGWPLYRGNLPEAMRPHLQAALGSNGSFDRLFDSIGAAENHARLATGSSQVAGQRRHSEHVYNILRAAADAADLNDDGDAQRPSISHSESAETVRQAAIDNMVAAVEAVPELPLAAQRSDRLSEADACAVTLREAINDAAAEELGTALVKAKYAADSDTADQDSETQALHDAIEKLRGAPFSSPPDEPQTARCFLERAEAATVVPLQALP